MNHNAKRLGLAVLSVGSIGCFLSAAYPRIYAWNEVSSAATIATQRAANCRIITPSVQVNTIPVDGKSGRPLPAGSHVCDWAGVTGQINGTGAVDYIKVGQGEAIANILKSRGFKP